MALKGLQLTAGSLIAVTMTRPLLPERPRFLCRMDISPANG